MGQRPELERLTRGLAELAIPRADKASPWGFVAMAGMAALFFLVRRQRAGGAVVGGGVLLVLWVVLFVLHLPVVHAAPQAHAGAARARAWWCGSRVISAGGVFLDWTA